MKLLAKYILAFFLSFLALTVTTTINSRAEAQQPTGTPLINVTDPNAVDSWEFQQVKNYLEKCKNSKDKELPLVLTSRKVEISGGTLENCQAARFYLQDLQRKLDQDDKSDCAKAKKLFADAFQEQSKKCGPFGAKDCGPKGSGFHKCKDHLSSTSSEEFDSFDPSERATMYEECPYYAKADAASVKEEKSTLEQEVFESEKELKTMIDNLTEDQKATTEAQQANDREIAELEKASKKAIEDLQAKLKEIEDSVGDESGKIRTGIKDLSTQLQQKKIVVAGAASADYGKSLNQIQKECYSIGLAAANTESAKLKKGTATQYNLNVAKAGILSHLRSTANKAYRECQESRKFKGDDELAYQKYKETNQLLSLEVTNAEEKIKELQAQAATLPQLAEGKKQELIRKQYALAIEINQEIMTKKRNASQLAMISEQKQQTARSFIAKKQQDQSMKENEYRAIKNVTNVVNRYSNRSSIPTLEQFNEASDAVSALEGARAYRTEQCCNDVSTIAPSEKSICTSGSQEGKTPRGGGDSDKE